MSTGREAAGLLASSAPSTPPPHHCDYSCYNTTRTSILIILITTIVTIIIVITISTVIIVIIATTRAMIEGLSVELDIYRFLHIDIHSEKSNTQQQSTDLHKKKKSIQKHR